MSKIIIISFFICYLLSAVAKAEEYFYVYRYDQRPPDEVFRDGIGAWGGNDDVYEHMTGSSCSTGSMTSAFVSTTILQRYAELLQGAREVSRRTQGSTFTGYIYRIRADESFYNMVESFLYYRRINQRSDLLSQAQIAGFSWEYIVPIRIPSVNIQDVTVTEYDEAGVIQSVSTTLNPNYIYRDTHTSPLPYTGSYSNRRRLRTLIALIPIIGACMYSQRDDVRNDLGKSKLIYLEDVLF